MIGSSFSYAGLFSGVGMIEYACEQLGGEPVFMCEQDEFCQRILRRRYPGTVLYEDVKTLSASVYRGLVDVLVGGFPCQDISSAGRGAGLKGKRSGLWSEFFRIIGEIQPKIALIENVAMLRNRGMDVVLHDLASIGYDAEWDVIPAAAVGAPHLRERIWIVARPSELAEQPVYGEVALDRQKEPKTFSFVTKIPRSGRMTPDALLELEPTAPRKTKRSEGWSHWVGASLFGGENAQLWPTASARDYKDTGDLNCVPENSLLPRRVFHVEQGTKMLPTPTATMGDRGGRGDLLQVVRGNTSPSGHFASGLLPTPTAKDDGKSPEAHMHMKRTKMPGGPRNSITSLAVLARNEFRQANGELWPTPSKADGTGGPGRSEKRTGGDNLRTAVQSEIKGSLNPTWSEWLMGMPLWWTDPTVPTEFCTPVPWDAEPLHVAERVASGVKHRTSRLSAIGNSVVWPCAFYALSRALDATPAMFEHMEMAA